MPELSATIFVSGNNKNLCSEISSYKENISVKFREPDLLHKLKYLLHLIDTSSSLENASQKIISTYSECRENNTKLIVSLIFDRVIEKDKVFHFQKLLNELGKSEPLHRLVIVNDLYTESNKKPVTTLDSELFHIFLVNSINISSKGNNQIHPLHLYDYLEAVIKIFFLNSTAGKTFYLRGDSLTDLELAYLVKKIVIDEKPDFQINSQAENTPSDTESQNLSNNTQIDLNWRPQLDFENFLRSLYFQSRQKNTEEVEEIDSAPSSKNKIKSLYIKTFQLVKSKLNHKYRQKNEGKKGNGYLLKTAIFILAIYFLNAAIFATSMYLSLNSLAQSLNYVRQGNINESSLKVKESNKFNNYASNTYWLIKPLVSLYSKNYEEEIHNLFSFSQYLENSLVNLQQAYILSEKIYQSFNDQSNGVNIQDQSLALKTSLGQVYDNLSQINIMVSSKKLPSYVEDKLINDPTFKQLSTIEEQLTQAIKLVNILPAIGEPEATKNIAIVVQDQDEIRSLGGVIKYLIHVTVENQKIKEIKIYNQKDISSLNDGSVKAPDVVAAITGNQSWNFRDMTYFGDFSQTSQYLSWYIEKLTGNKINTVISVNKSLFESLLDETGDISVSGKHIVSTSLKNPIGELESDTLRQVIDQYISQYRTNKLTLAKVGRVVTNEINKGNVFIWTDNQILETSISSQPFSGIITPYHCHAALANYNNCISQTTFLSESNFTVSPVNPFIKREVIHKIDLRQDHSIHEYQLNYHFTADLSVLNRDYRIIYQLYAPLGSVLESLNVDGQELQITNFNKQKYGQFEFIQMPLALTMNQDHAVKIRFKSVFTLTQDISQTAYSITDIRQSGLSDQGYGLIINLPENTHPSLVTDKVDTKPQQIYYRFPVKTSTFGLGLGLTR